MSALNLKQQSLTVHSINTGVPHAVVFVEDLENVAVQQLGAEMRYHAALCAEGHEREFCDAARPPKHRHPHL